MNFKHERKLQYTKECAGGDEIRKLEMPTLQKWYSDLSSTNSQNILLQIDNTLQENGYAFQTIRRNDIRSITIATVSTSSTA